MTKNTLNIAKLISKMEWQYLQFEEFIAKLRELLEEKVLTKALGNQWVLMEIEHPMKDGRPIAGVRLFNYKSGSLKFQLCYIGSNGETEGRMNSFRAHFLVFIGPEKNEKVAKIAKELEEGINEICGIQERVEKKSAGKEIAKANAENHRLAFDVSPLVTGNRELVWTASADFRNEFVKCTLGYYKDLSSSEGSRLNVMKIEGKELVARLARKGNFLLIELNGNAKDVEWAAGRIKKQAENVQRSAQFLRMTPKGGVYEGQKLINRK
ncbi:MAG: hypothetical protein ABIH99_04910 [Candidatus Micrarchaeota archaeon]